MEQIQEYLDQMCQTLQNLPQDKIARMIDVLKRARAEGRRIFLFGNGGSAATASHIAVDLIKGTARPGQPRLKVITLNDGIPTLTAYANDFGYETVFAGPLEALAEPGDVAIGISASGNSANVLRAMDVARERGLVTVGLTGFQGGRLKEKVDLCIIVPSESMQQIEDAHLVILHAIFLALC
ncbi:MAG TPA: SIS domain-containing protein [Anaerolineae bacterium]|nr:SIS domain-containing protein [Anaerolineae bacterium]